MLNSVLFHAYTQTCSMIFTFNFYFRLYNCNSFSYYFFNRIIRFMSLYLWDLNFKFQILGNLTQRSAVSFSKMHALPSLLLLAPLTQRSSMLLLHQLPQRSDPQQTNNKVFKDTIPTIPTNQ